jgi:hypothetical protein
MGSVRLDDGFPRNPKVVSLPLEARWAYIESLCYAAEFETDGVIPEAVAANGPIRDALVRVGLWEIGTASVIIHDYLIYNESRSERERKRNRTRSVRASVQSSDHVVGSSKASNPSGFELFWNLYPRKVGKPKARSAFEHATRTVPEQNIIDGAKRYRDDPNRSDEFTAHPTTWLNRAGWDDDPLPPRGKGNDGGPTPWNR